MAFVTINAEQENLTVSQMRKRLAQILSHLNGEQQVASFSFRVDMPNYRPSPLISTMTVVHGELARPEND